MKSLDVNVGSGRVPWANATTQRDNTYQPAGWVLPGGQRTEVRARAETVASNIDQIIRGRAPMFEITFRPSGEPLPKMLPTDFGVMR